MFGTKAFVYTLDLLLISVIITLVVSLITYSYYDVSYNNLWNNDLTFIESDIFMNGKDLNMRISDYNWHICRTVFIYSLDRNSIACIGG